MNITAPPEGIAGVRRRIGELAQAGAGSRLRRRSARRGVHAASAARIIFIYRVNIDVRGVRNRL
jgi:hypothetical protein